MTDTRRPASRVSGALRNALIAGVLAGVTRFIFAVTLEQMTAGPALAMSLWYLLGTAVLVFCGIIVIGALVARSTRARR